MTIVVKLFGRAFQIYDDVINLVEEKFGKMKNGLGEDITEGKISFPIIYCVSRIFGRRMSVYVINDRSTVDSSLNEELSGSEEPEEDLLELVNTSNVYQLTKSLKEINPNPTARDLNRLYDILKEKTNDKEKIEEAIDILRSKK